MRKKTLITIPPQLQSDYFFEHNTTVEIDIEATKNNEVLHINDLFPYELAYYAKIESYRPWKDAEITVLQLFNYWKPLSKTLAQLFEKRDRLNVQKPMKQGIALFIQCLFWVNDLPVIFYEQTIRDNDLTWKPVNVIERLEFILHRPNFYHSFVQLNELMIELEKQYHIKKASKQ